MCLNKGLFIFDQAMCTFKPYGYETIQYETCFWMSNLNVYYYNLFVLKIIRTVVQLFTSVNKSNYNVHRSFNKNKCSASLRFDS